MYRIFCDSVENYRRQYGDDDGYRAKLASPLCLLADASAFHEEKRANSKRFQEASDLLRYMEGRVDKYPKLKAFI
jgi:hypothetical protein